MSDAEIHQGGGAAESQLLRQWSGFHSWRRDCRTVGGDQALFLSSNTDRLSLEWLLLTMQTISILCIPLNLKNEMSAKLARGNHVGRLAISWCKAHIS
jgi:hypothetical protein